MALRRKFSTLSIFLAVLLSTSLTPSPALGSASGAPACATLCWSLTAPPTFTASGDGYGADAPYHNGFNSSVKGTVYLVMRNQLGQTVGIDPTTTTVNAGGNATLHPGISGLLPPGNYSTYIFATNAAGVAISNETAGSLESTYSIRVVGTSMSYGQTGPINLSFTIENVSPSPVVVNVTVIARDPQSNETIWQNQTEVTIPANSTADVPPMLVGTDNIPPCSVIVTILMQDQDGNNLGPPSGASGDCGDVT
jgi:hypothetical protein